MVGVYCYWNRTGLSGSRGEGVRRGEVRGAFGLCTGKRGVVGRQEGGERKTRRKRKDKEEREKGLETEKRKKEEK